MGKIIQLDKNTINKIAAGEVIERPSAVVKELVENALDAKASAVTIEIKDGGIAMVRITDNGSGIATDDIKTAFLRHATSKITSIEDLFTVKSLGFRGEALASIASVAQVELITKVSNELLGTRYIIEGGEEKNTENIGCPSGTTFIVRNLFYNTPVRRKFLKTASTEAGYVSELVERLAISHPNVAFKFISNGQTKMHTSGNGNIKDIIYSIYGRDIASNIKKVNFDENDFSIDGYIGKPIISRGNRNFENYYINGRFIKSSIISKAIEEAYKPYTMQHKYPFVTLLIIIDSQYIDVNVHPTKMEIRFSNPEEIYSNVYHAISNALTQTTLIPEVSLIAEKKEDKKIVKTTVPEPFEKQRIARQNSFLRESSGNYSNKTEKINLPEVTTNVEKEKKEENNLVIKNSDEIIIKEKVPVEIVQKEVLQKEIVQEEIVHGIVDVVEKEKIVPETLSNDSCNICNNSTTKVEQISLFDTSSHEEQLKNIKIIGQVFLTYWIIELDSKMYIIDQHAAHEKVMYEKIMKRLKNKECLSQIIAPPIIICLNMKEEEKLKSYMKTFKDIGFEIEHFGGRDYCISAVPVEMYGITSKTLFLELLDTLEDNERYTPEIVLEKTASMACKAAVKGNNKMSFIEAEHLIKEMFSLENPFNCPHGRPTTISLSKNELEKKFKRQL